ncbi:MAG TPA: vWA domain-containing protein [Thermoplasmata archaeon]|jgi:von Willebrand factor type A domain|nr:vWA domain-containing protein [Thermoplasmata archaeon]
MAGTPAYPPSPAPLRERNVLLLDLSKSMLAPLPDSNPGQPDRQKIEVARTAVFRILQDAATNGSLFGLVTFTETVRVPVPLTEIHRENLPYVENLISMLTPSGRSAIWDALAVGADLLRLGSQGVQGNLVLVTDGWDNASTRFDVQVPGAATIGEGKIDLVPYMLPAGSRLTLRIIGIGNGAEKDKGVDAVRMNYLLSQMGVRAATVGAPPAFSFQEVTTGSQLFAQMVNAFLDVGYEDDRPMEELHPEELARHAANAARALKEPQQHATVSRIDSAHAAARSNPDGTYSEAAELEVDVLANAGGTTPAYLKERYGPLGEVVEAYLAGQPERALALLGQASTVLPPVTRLYWEARILYQQRSIVEAARALLQAWAEAEKLPAASQPRILRRLALLQARMQNDKETETLVRFIDDTEHRLGSTDAAKKERLMELFAKLMDLRGTYQLTRLAGEGDVKDAAIKHEEAVEEVFGLLQDTRLDLAAEGPAVESALDFIEICLAEMR